MIFNRIANLFNPKPQTTVEKFCNEEAMLLLGRMASNQLKDKQIKDLNDSEFKVFSQWGDDGIIQYLLQTVAISRKIFIEFGVENYQEANTRFLLMNNNWKGLVIDGSAENIQHIKSRNWYWRYNLTAISEFITRDNINELFNKNNFSGSIGLLSIDIDGNDYWIFQSIVAVQPDIIISEYNSLFGAEHAISIPYDPKFQRTQAHYSNLYWGASLKALIHIASIKGYAFIGCNNNGNNAFFVKNEKLGVLRTKTCKEGFVESQFRESRDKLGNLTYLSGADRLALISDKNVIEVTTGEVCLIKKLYNL